jgi:RNA polymerase sigma-70 factor (ECF subfamily)
MRIDFAFGDEAVGIVPVIIRRYKEAAARNTAAIAGMPTPFNATRLLAELPRLRRYARILTDDPERADRLVEETLARARQMQDESTMEPTRSTQLLALLRAVNADTDSTGRMVPSHPDRGTGMLAQLHALPLEQREVLVLVAVERLSYTEIAGLLRMPVATVIARLSQARETLRASAVKPASAPNAN